MIDNHPDYFDYDDPCDYEEWGVWDDSREIELMVIPANRMLSMTGLSFPGGG